MKKLALLAAVLVAAVLVFDNATGRLGILPGGDSPEEAQVRALEGRFDAAKREMNQSMRSAGLAGLDTTGNVESARKDVLRIQEDLAKLRPRLTSESAKKRAAALDAAIKALRSDMRW